MLKGALVESRDFLFQSDSQSRYAIHFDNLPLYLTDGSTVIKMGGLKGKLGSGYDSVKRQLYLFLHINRRVEGTHDFKSAIRPLRHVVAIDGSSIDLMKLGAPLRRRGRTENVGTMIELQRKKPMVPKSFLNNLIDLFEPSSGLIILEVSWRGAGSRGNRTDGDRGGKGFELERKGKPSGAEGETASVADRLSVLGCLGTREGDFPETSEIVPKAPATSIEEGGIEVEAASAAD